MRGGELDRLCASAVSAARAHARTGRGRAVGRRRAAVGRPFEVDRRRRAHCAQLARRSQRRGRGRRLGGAATREWLQLELHADRLVGLGREAHVQHARRRHGQLGALGSSRGHGRLEWGAQHALARWQRQAEPPAERRLKRRRTRAPRQRALRVGHSAARLR